MSRSRRSVTYIYSTGSITQYDNPIKNLSKDIFNFINTEYKLGMTCDEYQNRVNSGRIIFILDALDEMSKRLDSEVAHNNLD